MTGLTTDETEAAARAMWEIPPDTLPAGCVWPSWDEVIEHVDYEQLVAAGRRLARAGLEAAEQLIAERLQGGHGEGYSVSDPALITSGHRVEAVETTSTGTRWFLRCETPHKSCEKYQGRHVDQEDPA